MASTPGAFRIAAGGILFLFLFISSVAQTADRSSSSAKDEDTLIDRDFAQKRVVELRALIAHHDDLYFRHAEPEITDEAYDKLKLELGLLLRAHPELASADSSLPDDHTEGFSKAAHRVPALSLEKAYSQAEVENFCTKIESSLGHSAQFLVEPKIDGLSISAVYEHGRFVRAITRGNGREGDDITANARMIRSLPSELKPRGPSAVPIPDFVELRGEIYVSFAEFNRLNQDREADGEPPFSHPRSVAAGTIKASDPMETAERHLDVVFYGWGAWEPIEKQPATQNDFHTLARSWGLPTLETFQLVHTGKDVWPALLKFSQIRPSLRAPTDGAVVKLDDVGSRAQFGSSARSPNWAIAFKYAPNRVNTRLSSVSFQVGRTGVITPVAEFEPVQLGGSTVSRACLFNRLQIERLDLRLGDFVVVEKAGEIIPQIVDIDKTRRTVDSKSIVFPSTCPVCGTALVALPQSVTIRCPNPACPAQLEHRLLHFAGKSGVNIKGLGAATASSLLSKGKVHRCADLYRLRISDLSGSEGVGEKAAPRLIAEIDHSRGAELWRIISGLGLPGVGPAKAKILAAHFASLDQFAEAQEKDLPPELGEATLLALREFFSEEKNRGDLRDLAAAMKTRPAPS